MVCQFCGKQHITNREQSILELLAMGLSNKQIANDIGISEQTVKNHVSWLFEKFGVQSRIALLIKLLKEGIVKL